MEDDKNTARVRNRPKKYNKGVRAPKLEPGESVCDDCGIVCGEGFLYKINKKGSVMLCDACMSPRKIVYLNGVFGLLDRAVSEVVSRRLYFDEIFCSLMALATGVDEKVIFKSLAEKTGRPWRVPNFSRVALLEKLK